MTKYHKIILSASIIGLLTYVLPVVTVGGQGFSLMHEYFQSIGRIWIVRLPFAISLILAFIGDTKVPFGKGKSISFIVLSIIAIFFNFMIIAEASDDGGLVGIGIGGILAYLCAIVILVSGALALKEGNHFDKEKLTELGKKGATLTKSAVNVTTKVAKTAVDEVKKEIDKTKEKGD
ncbi:MAG: hypothetical protein SPD91_04715 [Streptococcus hyointestinalis]|uniref:hypothetical protein n=1 Tax=Streptococcus hyointestinalis TaxID=1337 RepID=UPI002A82831A|nr:hypothetical protein [Streptococcus hyointestinalis]MDY4553754.1 hypothetical protein [Streptococcus hyointestinalis]